MRQPCHQVQHDLHLCVSDHPAAHSAALERVHPAPAKPASADLLRATAAASTSLCQRTGHPTDLHQQQPIESNVTPVPAGHDEPAAAE